MDFNFQPVLQKLVREFRMQNDIVPQDLGDTIVFARKPSLIEYLLGKKGVTCSHDRSFAEEQLGADIPNFQKVWDSHLRQLATADALREMFPDALELFPALIFNRDAYAVHVLAHADIVITASGDEFLKTVAQLIGDETVLVAVNSDPETSDGALTIQLPDLQAGLKGNCELAFSRRTRIEAIHNSKVIGSALDSIFVGSEDRFATSALTQIFPDGRKEAWTCSGIVFYPGSGSTGWPLSASGNWDSSALDDQCTLFSNVAASSGAMVVTEPFRGRISNYSLASTEIDPGVAITLESLLQSGGLLEIDGLVQPFPIGSTIRVELDDDPRWLKLALLTSGDEVSQSCRGKKVFFAHEKRVSMSRYRLSLAATERRVSETQKSSGVCFVAAGAAIEPTSRFGCAIKLPQSEVFSASDRRFDMLVTEPRGAVFACPLQKHGGNIVELQARTAGQKLILDGYSPFEIPQWERVGVRLSERVTVSLSKAKKVNC